MLGEDSLVTLVYLNIQWVITNDDGAELRMPINLVGEAFETPYLGPGPSKLIAGFTSRPAHSTQFPIPR